MPAAVRRNPVTDHGRPFANVDPAMLIATTYDGDQIGLLVVAPSTASGPVEMVMARAADPANRVRASALLTVPPVAETSDEQLAWDNDGGPGRKGRRR